MSGIGLSQNLYIKAKKIIPGGTQLLSKRPEMFLPNLWPAYYKEAKGCQIWDLDGRKYIDTSYMGIGSCILGYADNDVNTAVIKAIKKGTMSTLNCPEEVELAELLCDIHPWAKMARFARTGGEAMAIAVRISRAKTGRDLILFCGYHGWHDWYISANIASKKSLDGHLLPGLESKGVPRALAGSAIPFNYNDTEGFLKLIRRHGKRIAAIIMEPIRHHYPKNRFLEIIRKTTEKIGSVLIFDEVSSGWRLCLGGAHLKLKVYPDMCVFAKGISNGYPMAVIMGKKKVMNKVQDTFISSTYWTERIGPVAALATIKKMKGLNVSKHIGRIGKIIQDSWKELAERHGLDIAVSGVYPLSNFCFNYKEKQVLKTLFTQTMLEKGFLATTAFYTSLAHEGIYVEKYIKAVDDTFAFISEAIKEKKVKKYLKGPVCDSGFKRLT